MKGFIFFSETWIRLSDISTVRFEKRAEIEKETKYEFVSIVRFSVVISLKNSERYTEDCQDAAYAAETMAGLRLDEVCRLLSENNH